MRSDNRVGYISSTWRGIIVSDVSKIENAFFLVVLILDLGGKVVADVADVSDLVLHDEGNFGAHGQSDL